MKLNRKFFERDAEMVARELLGKEIFRKNGSKLLKAKIVETEAYYDEKDPASRARQNGDLRQTMLMDAGTILVYGVHNNWLINFVTNKKDKAEAVLIRALEPVNFEWKTNGPGLLTKALNIDKRFHKINICDSIEIWLNNAKESKIDIVESFRVGVANDLPKKLRFYIRDNKFVSKI